jgi:nucleoside-diphosphate-sugar epimerase
MHVLVTGAGGFIGSAVMKKAREAGWRVTGVARRPGSEAMEIADLRKPIENWPTPDAVIHLAGSYVGGNAFEMFETDLAIARNVIAWGKSQGVRRWVFASAAEVYGPVQGTATEETVPHPAIPYGRVKLEIERLLAEVANDVPDCHVAILRIGEVYGNDGRLIRELKARLERGFCPWPGSGRVLLSFIHVDDVASALLQAAERAPAGVSIYNLGDDEPAAWRSFLQYLAKRLDTRPAVFLPLPLAYAYMLANQLEGRVIGRPPTVTRHVIRLLLTPKVLSNQCIKQALGFALCYPDFRSGLEAVLNGVPHHA